MKPQPFPSSNEDRSSRYQSSSSRPVSPDRPDETDEADEVDLEQSLRDLDQSLLLLKARYAQVQTDRQLQQNLRDRKEQIERQLQHPISQTAQRELKQDLKRIRQQLDELELALESQLFSWNGLKEFFWQAVRFGGLGVMVGWVLRSLVR